MEIREALDKAEATLTSSPEPVEAPAPEAPPVEVAAVEAPVEVEQAPKAERARGEDGKFIKAEKAPEKSPAAPKGDVHGAAPTVPPTGPGKADGTAPSPVPSAEPAHHPVKPPQAWTPAAREAFAKAPPEVQHEVAKREREIAITLQQTAEARKTAEAVTKTLAPFEGLARANGMDAMSYAGSVMQTAAALQMGAPGQRAGIIAQLINTYGVDLEAINSALQGQPARSAQPEVDVNRLIEQRFQAMEAQRVQQENMRAAQAFIDSQPEFLGDVQEDMAEILRLDRARGGNLTPQQAYDRACKLNENVQAVLAQRKAAEAARTAHAATARTQAAASSVRSTPASAPPRAATKPASVRDALDAADATLSGRV